MIESLALIPSAVESQLKRNAAFRELREMVLNSVASEHSKRNYAKALVICRTTTLNSCPFFTVPGRSTLSFDCGRRLPGVDRVFQPHRNCHRPHPTAFANQVHDDPPALAELNVIKR